MSGLDPSGAGTGTGGFALPRGFRAAAVHCGIRKPRPDLALIASDCDAAAAALFTTNRVKAAPVLVSAEHLHRSKGRARAVVVNAGNANACTGQSGLAAARATAAEAARLLGVPVEGVLVASTGVIGQPLPVDRLLAGLPAAVAGLSAAGGPAAAEAILTTDLVVKVAHEVVSTPSGAYTIAGMAKGSGMIHPDLATTLCFVTSDAAIEPDELDAVLRRAADRSFNRISVDGDTSTNDMVAVLANGASGVAAGGPGLGAFEAALTRVLVNLALAVVRDGEGATKLVTVEVTGARSEADALRVARTIAGSPLVKTAVHGADANWGRIVAAAGRAGVELDPARLAVWISGLPILKPGYRSDFSEPDAKALLERSDVTLTVDLGSGPHAAAVWTCDLGPGYVAINASYRS